MILAYLYFTQIASAKPTHSAAVVDPSSIELKITLESGSPSVESGMILNPDVVECLRRFVQPGPEEFSIGLAGRVNEEGAISAPTVLGTNTKMNLCLVSALKQVSVLNPSPGPFRVRIFRSDVPVPGAKSFRLDPVAEHKKFE